MKIILLDQAVTEHKIGLTNKSNAITEFASTGMRSVTMNMIVLAQRIKTILVSK